MRATIKQLRAFVAVAKTESVVEACGVVHLSQPALSSALKKLEDAIGGQLFSRKNRMLALTPEGEAFLPEAERLLQDWDYLMGDMKSRFSLRRGKVSIAAMSSIACNQLPSAIYKFRETFPNINVAINDVVAEEVVEKVRSGQVGLGVTFDPGEADDLNFEPLFLDPFVAIMPANHPLIHEDRVTWKNITKQEFILLQRSSFSRKMIEQEVAASGYDLNIAYEANQLASIGRMVSAGLGVSVVPTLCVQLMEELGAVHRPLVDPVISRQVGILTRSRYPLSLATIAMKDVLVDYFRIENSPPL